MTNRTTNRNTSPNSSFEDTIQTRPATPAEISYRDGYVQGQNASMKLEYEKQRLHEAYRARNNESTASGLLLGFFLTTFAAIEMRPSCTLTKPIDHWLVES